MAQTESQLSINWIPLADVRSRNSDPKSSHRAEERMKRSGLMSSQCLTVLDLVKQNPGRTSKELALLSKLDRHMIARRTSDLEDRNLIYTTGRNSGEQIRWWPNRRSVVRESK